MCSFLFTNKKNFDIDHVNKKLKNRGPDFTNFETLDNFFYLHNLLSITGKLTKQPLYSDDLILLYNGEIYNYNDFGNFESDGYSILELYKNKGHESFKYLDGEFAIFLYDKYLKRFYISTDTFGTKPVYYSIENSNIGISSYAEPLQKLGFNNIKRATPNTTLIIDSDRFEIIDSFTNYTFNLNQYKNTYEDWEISFYESIKKRVMGLNHNILVPLSSGYDSGLICSVLNNLNIDYVSFSIIGKENENVLLDRIHKNKNSNKEIIKSIESVDINRIRNTFEEEVQYFSYGPNPYEFTHNGFDDPGSIGLYYVLNNSKIKYNTKVVLSGHGSDEMMTNIPNYGFKTNTPHPFPENLNDVFPWGNFYYGSQWSYLMKEECVAGSLGIETRYPFLDRIVVQEFLNLSVEFKNKYYKGPIKHIFDKLQYPYSEQKIGFQIN